MTIKIDTDLILDDLILVKHLNQLDSPFLQVINNVFDEVKNGLDNRIQTIFPKYTLHNTQHSFRIINYMSQIVEDYTKLSELEITLLICSALCHDIGMAPHDEDIKAIQSDDFSFCDVKYSSMRKLMPDDQHTLQEYVRRIHAEMSGRFVREKLKSILIIPKLYNLDFAEELAIICESHTKDCDWLKSKLKAHDVRGDYHFNAQYVAGILRIADILDIDGNRTPYKLYKLLSPKGISDEEWKQNFVVSNNEKIIINNKTHQKKIVFHGKATNADTHRKILNYIDWVKNELTDVVALVHGMQPQYSLIYDTIPEVNIQTEGYTFSGYKMTLKFQAISSLLMGEKIYGSKSLGLRELIQNSLDACRIRQENDNITREFGEDKYIPKVKVILDIEKNQVIIKDNGIGMSIDVIKNHFLNIGVSYYKSFDFLLKDFDYKPIGNFGIGFLSCFMLSDNVLVHTRHVKSKNKYKVELEKENEWTSLTENEDINFEGTEVILNYQHFMTVFDNSPEKVKNFLNKFFLTDGIEFKLIEKPKNIIDINNPSNASIPLDKGVFQIKLEDYLQDVEGYVLVKNKRSFIKDFSEIDYPGDLYLYQRKTYNEDIEEYDDEYLEPLVQVEDLSKLNIDDYVNMNEFKYLKIPIVDYSIKDDFNNGMKFTDEDIDEVVSKMDNKLTWISILIPKQFHSEINEYTYEEGEEILEGLYFSHLVDIGHSSECRTKVYIEKVKLFEGRQNELYLPFDDRKRHSWSIFNNGPRKELFIRNVLIKDFGFILPVTASVFEVLTIVANVKSRKIIPDISRNDIDKKSEETINYIIGKAIHLGAIENIEYGADEENTLKNFVASFYENTTDFEK